MKSTLGQLGLMRLATLAATLAQSVMVVRSLSLESIGQYYLVTTVAYLGNAAIFVGADMAMQRQLATLASDRRLNRRGMLAYVFTVAGCGAALLFATSAAYFWSTSARPAASLPWLCCLLSLGNYFALTSRNAVLLCGKPVSASALQLVEAIGKVVLIGLAVNAQGTSAETLVLATAGGSLLSAACACALLARATTSTNRPYREPFRPLARKIAAIGSAGLLNWGQLQGYRPLLAALMPTTEIIGTVALLTTLGSTAGSSLSTILAQMHVQQQYASNGATSAQYLKHVALAAAAGAVLLLPLAFVFLVITEKTALSPFLYLFVIGLLVEAGNAAVGIAINHCNVLGQPVWHLPLAGLLGCAVTLALLLVVPSSDHPHLLIGTAIGLGQLVTVLVTWSFTLALARRQHAQS
jgi:hypothetical protein